MIGLSQSNMSHAKSIGHTGEAKSRDQDSVGKLQSTKSFTTLTTALNGCWASCSYWKKLGLGTGPCKALRVIIEEGRAEVN